MSSVGALTIAIGSLFHEMGSPTEKVAFLRNKRKLRWRLTKLRLRQVKATVEYVVDQDEVSAKPATLEKKDFQSTKPVLVRQLSHAFDHTNGQALYALHQGDVSS